MSWMPGFIGNDGPPESLGLEIWCLGLRCGTCRVNKAEDKTLADFPPSRYVHQLVLIEF